MLYDSNQYDPADSGYGPIPEGDYDFTVRGANATVSKNGNDMIELELEVKIGSEQTITAYDWLVAVKSSLWKIHSFCEAVGRDFHAGELMPEHCLSRQGRAHFTLGSPNQKGRQYLQVDRYLAPAGTVNKSQEGKLPEASQETSHSGSDDEIPF